MNQNKDFSSKVFRSPALGTLTHWKSVLADVHHYVELLFEFIFVELLIGRNFFGIYSKKFSNFWSQSFVKLLLKKNFLRTFDWTIFSNFWLKGTLSNFCSKIFRRTFSQICFVKFFWLKIFLKLLHHLIFSSKSEFVELLLIAEYLIEL